jgi:hypothetical protein
MNADTTEEIATYKGIAIGYSDCAGYVEKFRDGLNGIAKEIMYEPLTIISESMRKTAVKINAGIIEKEENR